MFVPSSERGGGEFTDKGPVDKQEMVEIFVIKQSFRVFRFEYLVGKSRIQIRISGR